MDEKCPKIKNFHSPMDLFVLAFMNSSIFGLCFSISMTHEKILEQKLSLRNKIGFVGRNAGFITTAYSLNVLISEILSQRKNKNRFIASFMSSTIPIAVASIPYYYKNNNPFFPKSTLMIGSILIFMAELSNVKMGSFLSKIE